jgi:hypothetical protein
LDPDILAAASPDRISSLFDWDSSAYVIPQAFEPFFRQVPVDRATTALTLASLDRSILEALADSSIRPSAPAEGRAAAAAELRCRDVRDAEREAARRERRSETDRIVALFDALGTSEQVAVMELLAHERGDSHETLGYSADAASLLARHANSVSLPSLDPAQLAFGYVSARVRNLGWNVGTHRGAPNGGAAGEILGIDVAISRNYQQATHGHRSDVSTFVGKYLWLARHELVGYLAERLPIVEDSSLVPPPVDPSSFAEAPSPATDILHPEARADWISDPFAALVPQHQLPTGTQIELANTWVREAPLPSADQLLRIDSESAPPGFQSGKWLILKAWARRTDDESLADSLFWASAFAVPKNHIDLLVEDARRALISDLETNTAGLRRVESYMDPLEAAWAPWVHDDYVRHHHKTVDAAGGPITIPIDATACSFHWEGLDGESEILMPAEWLRRDLGVVELRGGAFLSRQGTPVAMYDTSIGQVLLAREDVLLNLLEREGLCLGWGLRVQRVPNSTLFQDEWPMARRDWRSVATLQDAEILTIGVSDGWDELPPRKADE